MQQKNQKITKEMFIKQVDKYYKKYSNAFVTELAKDLNVHTRTIYYRLKVLGLKDKYCRGYQKFLDN